MNANKKVIPTAFFIKSVIILMYGAEKMTSSIDIIPAMVPLPTLFIRKKTGIVDNAQNSDTPTFTPKVISPKRRADRR
jgi:hypothetical protein